MSETFHPSIQSQRSEIINENLSTRIVKEAGSEHAVCVTHLQCILLIIRVVSLPEMPLHHTLSPSLTGCPPCPVGALLSLFNLEILQSCHHECSVGALPSHIELHCHLTSRVRFNVREVRGGGTIVITFHPPS